MGILKKLVSKMAITGEIERDVPLPDGTIITLRPLSNAQTTAAFGMVTTKVLRKVAGDKEDSTLLLQDDTILRARSIALVAYAIKKIDEEPVMEEGILRDEELEERRGMLEDLLDMEESLIDLLHREYTQLTLSRRNFFQDAVKNAEK